MGNKLDGFVMICGTTNSYLLIKKDVLETLTDSLDNPPYGKTEQRWLNMGTY